MAGTNENKHMKFRIAALLLSALFFLQACSRKEYKNNFNDPILFSKTVKELNNVVMQNGFPPIIASRNYAYACIAAYETVVLGDNRFQTLAGQIEHLPAMPKLDTADVNFQYASMLAFCKVGEAVTFPKGSMKEYVNRLDSIANAGNMSASMQEASKRLADSVTSHILRWSKNDNYAQTRTAEKYNITNEEGRWVPTAPSYAQALEPHWNEIRTMIMDSASQFTPPRPPAFDMKNKESKFYKEVMAVKNAGDSLTDEQKHIAEFWDDLGTRMNVEGHVMFVTKKFSPVGHWMNITGIAAKKAGADFSTTVSSYAKTAIAVFDAFIQCWDEKFRSNVIRPETAINKYIDDEWRPYLQTPPFPEYTCGHSTVSSSAAEILTNVFGDNFNYTDTSELEFGIKNRSFASFRQAAIENNWARFYGGIHYHNSCIISTEYGKKVGDLVNGHLKMKK
ncbi:MAG: vanadium-dependent haloperoxidase [Chitinophagaceae bacterium]|nr:vanadium-dependent haloperoxidase [Chitinophagaceae bacterium]MBK9485258.1 vanadium-dependent haloperoxidase [Chitinophagaceae bacterium]MBL0199824.1 vanadium-dependent haloperoxidase [Chitinophagaceae bacterium]